MRNSLLVLFLVITCLVAGCSGGNQSQLVEDQASSPSRQGMGGNFATSLEVEAAEQEQLWQAILEDPGAAGVDYDPRSITVNYAAEPEFPSALRNSPSPGLAAEDKPNDILRQNTEYHAVTNAIAARYQLAIDQQVYLRELNFATFKLGPKADGESIIESIRNEFADAIQDVTYSRLIYPCFDPDDPMYTSSTQTMGDQWGQKLVGCADAWDYTMGDPGIRIAVVDTGAYLDHEDLSGQVLDPLVYFPDEILDLANGDNTMEDHPDDGHGTFICGLVAANTNNGKGMAGVAPDSRIIPVKIYDEGSGNSVNHGTFVAGCMLGFELGAKAINLSWMSTGGSPQLRNMVNDIYNGGALLFVSAGNTGETQKTYPASYENAIAVGNSRADDSRHSSSTYGDWVDIAAPGVALSSTGNHGPDDYHGPWNGTSFSAPITAAAAALLWAYDPSLGNDEIRELLETTGPVATGFNESPEVVIRRLDIAAAFDELLVARIEPPVLDQLIHSGVVTLEPSVFGEVTQVDVLLNGAPLLQKFEAPWSFDIDTTSVEFGLATVRFVAYGSDGPHIVDLELAVDNTEGRFPLIEPFDAEPGGIIGLDLKNYSRDFLEGIKYISTTYWSPGDIRTNGPARWSFETTDSFGGTHHARLGAEGDTYGAFEIDALVSRRIDLTGVSEPTLTFSQHFNIEDGGHGYDRGWVYLTDDSGNTFTPAQIRSGGDAYYSGYTADWTKAEIDLSPVAGQIVNLVFAFESDTMVTGEQDGQPAGWWIDEVSVATAYQDTMPTVSEVVFEPSNIFGNVPGESQLLLSLEEPQLVDRVDYLLDFPPYDLEGDPNDRELIIDNGEAFSGEFSFADDLNGPNQIALLKVQYYDASDNHGIGYEIPVYIFNHLGDTNADGAVNQSDIDAYEGKIGLSSDAAGYTPFLDSDLDGLITEADASAVGYHWGETH